MIFILQGSLYLCRCAVTCYRCCSVTCGKCSRTCWREIFSNSYFGHLAAALHVKQTSDAEKRRESKTRLWWWIVCFYWRSVTTHSAASCGLFPDVTAVLCSLIKWNLNLFCCEFVAQTSLTAGAVRGSGQKVKWCWCYWLLIRDIILVCVCERMWGCVSF